ncbi:hypothetical protein KCU77_g6266, partial [Aureobasidium melanogenum]
MWRDSGPEPNSAEILALRWAAESFKYLIEVSAKLQAIRQKLTELGVEGYNVEMDSVRCNLEVAFDTARASERRYEDSHPLELPALTNNFAYNIFKPYSSNPKFWIWVAQGEPHHKHTAAGIPTWSPTVVLICRSTAYVWQSGRDAQCSADCGRM